ncbi:MAG: hypothetical protein HY717_02730 [Planctomycetes bacterium]|nr:hypothetical protein [Planctomycetota bacterium]
MKSPWPSSVAAGKLFFLAGLTLRAGLAQEGAAEGEAGARTIRFTYRFAPPALERQGDFHRLHMVGLENGGKAGEPALPRRLARLLLPPGAAVAGVTVIPSPPAALAERCLLAPAPEELDPAGGREPRPLSCNPDIYQSSGPYPPRPWEYLGAGVKHGRSIAFLALSPVVYFPRSGAVAWSEAIEVELELELAGGQGGGAALPLRPAQIQEMFEYVDNPPAAPELPASEFPAAGSGGSDEVAYAIITSPALAAAFQPLAEARQAGGLPAAVFTTDWIYARYDGRRPDGGEDDATRLRNFIIDAYRGRGLRWVLLGGDADGDSGCRECQPPVVPARYLKAFSATLIPADLYFGCLDGTFDGDADGIYGERNDGEGGGDVDLLFEVHVGRAPADSPEEAANFVRKTLAYEQSSGPILRRVLLAGEYLGFGGAYDWGGNLNDQIRTGSNDFIDTVGFENSPYRDFLQVRTLYDRDTLGNNWPPESLIEIIEQGVHLLNHIGHADISNVMKLTDARIDGLGGESYFLGYTQSCYAGAFDNRRADGTYGADSVIEHFLAAPAGAAAFIANSRNGWAGSFVPDGPSQRFNRRFWDAVLGQKILQWGAANDRSKEENLGTVQSNERARWCYYELNTLGDPALAIKLSTSRGSLSFDGKFYNPAGIATLILIDADLDLSPDRAETVPVRVRAEASGDAETLSLEEMGRASGVFQLSFQLDAGLAAADGVLQVAESDTLIAAYEDADDGSGASAAVEARAQVISPASLAGPCPPAGAVGVPYSFFLKPKGGLPPRAFFAETGYVEEPSAPLFEGIGLAMNWHDDDGFWSYALPFEFPFYGKIYETVTVSSNGYLELGPGNEREFINSAEKLIASTRVAPLWGDLVTSGNGDIYIEEKFDSIAFRWRGVDYNNREGINAEAELFADGRIRFGYGAGNHGFSPTIGISAGDGERYVLSQLSGRDDLGSAPGVFFLPTGLPEGLEVDPASGEIYGVPSEAVVGRAVSFRVEDSLKQFSRQHCAMTIRPEGLALESPQAGDLWLKGSQQAIRWHQFGAAGSRIRIDYNTDGSTKSFPFAIAASVPLADRSFPWTVPDLAAAAARLRIASLERPELFTYSGVFSIVAPTLVLLSPLAGDRWILGSEAAVRWASIGPTGARVRIDYNTDGSPVDFPLTLAADLPNTGEHRFAVPATPSPTCRLRLQSRDAPGVKAGVSGLFSIRPPSLAITSPNGGECLRIGETVRIVWSAEGSGDDPVLLEYNADGGDEEFPFQVEGGPFPARAGSAPWTVPEIPGARGRLRIRSLANSAADVSDGAFSMEYRCALRILFWTPFIDAVEQQIANSLAALERFEPDADVAFSTTLGPEALARELAGKDALLIPKQKQAGPDIDFAALGEQLGPALLEFLGRGGAVVICQQTRQSDLFLPAIGLMEADFLEEGARLCEVAEPLHAVVSGVRSNFAGPEHTATYRVRGPGARILVQDSSGNTVVAARDAGFGRLAFLGFDYYSFTSDTARLLSNALRIPLPESGLRLVSPAAGAAFLEGEEIPIRWFARGRAKGTARIDYNTTGSSAEFPHFLTEATPQTAGGDEGSFVWKAPPVPPDQEYLEVRLRVRPLAAPQEGEISPAPFHVVRPLEIRTARLPEGSVNLPYEALLEGGGGVPPHVFRVNGLPAGLIVQPAGERAAKIAGVPQRECWFCEVEVLLQDALGFSIRKSFPLPVILRALHLIQPNGGELWLSGSLQQIVWNVAGQVGSTVSLRFNRDGSLTDFPFLIAASAPIGMPYDWQLPVMDAPECRLQVRSDEFPEIFAVSQASFSIVGPTIRLTAPSGGECWEPGKRRLITWKSAGNSGGGVRIEYNLDGSTSDFPNLIAGAAPDTGAYEWTVPPELSESCRVRVSFEAAPENHDLSRDPFTIHAACRLSVLAWDPCRSSDERLEVVRQALAEREPELDFAVLSATAPEGLPEALANRDALIVLLPPLFCPTLDFRVLGVNPKPLLHGFVNAGGVVVFCSPGTASAQLLTGLGLLDSLQMVFNRDGPSCQVTSYLHPLAAGVPLEFAGPRSTSAYRLQGGDFEAVVGSDRFTVAAAREQGSGRWSLLGFDYQAANPASARLLANAARMRPIQDGLRLLSPAPGAVLAAGEAASIAWAARGERSGPVRLSFNTDGSASAFPFFIAEAPGEKSGGSYLWTAPEPPPGRHFTCRVQVEWSEPPELPARSEGVFHVVREAFAIVTGALEDGHHGAEYRSELRVSGGAPPYTWVEIRDLPAGLYAVAFEGESAAAVITGTPLVTITDQKVTVQIADALGSLAEKILPLNIFPSRVKLVAPAGGEYLLAGSPAEVRWEVSGYAGEKVRIEYNLDGGTSFFDGLAAEAAPIGSPFFWSVPEAVSGSCRMRIVSNLGLSSFSERTFAISGPRITCLSPNGEEAFETSTWRTIRWRSLGNPGGRVRIDMSLEGSTEQFPVVIAGDAPDQGAFRWQVPELPSRACRLRIRSISDPRLEDVSDNLFSIRYRAAIRGLVWIPYTGFEQREVRGAIAAATLFENDFDWALSKALTEVELQSELAGKEAFIMVQQERVSEVNFKARGHLLGPVLKEFAERGGAVVVLKQRGNALDFISAAGLLEAAEAGKGFDIPCQVELPDHPVVNQVPRQFNAASATAWYRAAGEGVKVYATAAGQPAVLGRDLGDGRVILIGFDYSDYTAASARLLGNAIRMAPEVERPRFVRGDANADGAIDIADAIFILEYLFLGRREPLCMDAADIDDSAAPGAAQAAIGLGDVFHLLWWIFTGGAPPAPPGPGAGGSVQGACGVDPQLRDGLDCRIHPPCAD